MDIGNQEYEVKKVSNPYSNLKHYLKHACITQTRNGGFAGYADDEPNEEQAKAELLPIMQKILTADEQRFVSLVFGLEDGTPHYLTETVKLMGWTTSHGNATKRLDATRRKLGAYLDESPEREREVIESLEPIEGLNIVSMSDELRRTPVEQLRLPARIANPIRYCGKTVGMLCTHTEHDLKYRGLGMESIQVVKDALKRLDPTLRLAWEETENPVEIERYDDEVRKKLNEVAARAGVTPRKLWRRVVVGAKALGVRNEIALYALDLQYPSP